jgi:hypothetical protein
MLDYLLDLGFRLFDCFYHPLLNFVNHELAVVLHRCLNPGNKKYHNDKIRMINMNHIQAQYIATKN